MENDILGFPILGPFAVYKYQLFVIRNSLKLNKPKGVSFYPDSILGEGT